MYPVSTLVPLVPVDPEIFSSYGRDGTGGPRAGLTPLARLGKAGIATSDTAAALLALHKAVTAAGGDFRVTELHRDVAVQHKARAKYDAWVHAGKPTPGTPGFDAVTMKAAFVATPGRSTHNAGRAIDVDLASLRFPGVPADRQLDRLWELAVPLGWRQVIKVATEGAAESWHFDFWGDLAGVKSRLGYEQAALCGAILVGHGDLSGYDAELQALLVRAGFAIGEIDGKVGARTRSALAAALGVAESVATTLIISRDADTLRRLLALPAA
jgi:hypothetical protein